MNTMKHGMAYEVPVVFTDSSEIFASCYFGIGKDKIG